MWGVALWEKVFIKNERIYQSCIRLAMPCGSETWCLRGNEMAILRTEKGMMRAISGIKSIAKRSQEFISLLGLKDTLDGLTRVSGV